MKETNNNVETIEVEEVKKESKFKSVCSKVGEGIKKNSKKIAVGAAVVAVGVIGYIVKNKLANPEEKEITDDVVDIIDVSDYADEVQSN